MTLSCNFFVVTKLRKIGLDVGGGLGFFLSTELQKDPDLGSFVGKSAILTQCTALWVPFEYLPVTVGSFRSPQPCSTAPTLTGDCPVEQRESCKRVTKFVNLAFADTEKTEVFSVLKGGPLRWLSKLGSASGADVCRCFCLCLCGRRIVEMSVVFLPCTCLTVTVCFCSGCD